MWLVTNWSWGCLRIWDEDGDKVVNLGMDSELVGRLQMGMEMNVRPNAAIYISGSTLRWAVPFDYSG